MRESFNNLAKALIAIRLRRGQLTDDLQDIWVRTRNQRNFHVNFQQSWPRMKVVGLQPRGCELYAICVIPESVGQKTIRWGHTEWCSKLIKADEQSHHGESTIYGALSRQKQGDTNESSALRTPLIILNVGAPMTSIIKITLIIVTNRELNSALIAIVGVGVITLQSLAYLMSSHTSKQFLKFWYIAMALVAVVDVVAVIVIGLTVVMIAAEHSENLNNFESTTLTLRIWMNIAAIVSCESSFVFTTAIIWIVRKFRKYLEQEFDNQRVLYSVERTGKVLCSKSIFYWLMNCPPFKRDQSQPQNRLA